VLTLHSRTPVLLYTNSEADYLAGVTRGTAKRWLSGYAFKSVKGHKIDRPPVTKEVPREESGVSFLDLVELVAIGQLKEFGLNLLDIRRIVDNCQQLFNVNRPLASLKFKVGGAEVFVDEAPGVVVEVLRGRARRAWQDVLEPFLATLDYQEELARRWWPLGRNECVLVDPEYGFGLPVIRGSGIRTEIILERLQVGDSSDQISQDFNIERSDVESALRFEASRFKHAA
jgi:uncharacterized protein (DUF433 family)